MKEDIFSVSETLRHTNSSEIFEILNGFIVERVLEWKTCFGVCTDDAAFLTGRNPSLVTKIKVMAGSNFCQRIATFIGKIWPPRKMSPELNEVLSQSVKIL
jgi:hypothetical protein